MKILVVALNVANHSKNGSNTVYLKRFLSCLKPEETNNYTLLVSREGLDILRPLFPELKYELYELEHLNYFSPKSIFAAKREAEKFQKYVNENHYDCVYISHFFAYFTRCKFNCRKVVTIHDIIELHEKIKGLTQLRSHIVFRYYLKCQLRTSDKIIAISDYVKNDIIKTFRNVDEEKIEVVRNSVAICENSVKPNNFSINKYFLFVGRAVPYKGFLTALKAYKVLNRHDYKIVFVCSKQGYWQNEIVPFIEENNLRDCVIHYQGISDENLKWLYENAKLFITPSQHEGFGYTPIEAAINGCPVISSTCEALPEATMGMAYYYEPVNDYNELAKKMGEVLDNPPSQERLGHISKTLSEAYSTSKQVDSIKRILIEK